MPCYQRLLPAAVACALLAAPALAAEPTGTLKKIKDSGVIVLGHRDSAIPFAYLAGGKQPVGYSLDLAQNVVNAVKKEMKMPNLQVRYNMVTGQTRIPLLQNGTIDIECGATTNNVERQRQVDFSIGIFEIGTRLLVKKDSGIKDFADLKGKNVVVSAGTTGERLMRAMNVRDKMDMNIVAAKDNGESFLMLESGRVVAFMTDDAMLYGERAKARNPAEWAVVGKPQSTEIYGCMVRKGDEQFKQLVDKALVNTYKSGQINAIYDKWFMKPIPPKNLNLNFPMSPQLKALIAKPSDKPAAI